MSLSSKIADAGRVRRLLGAIAALGAAAFLAGLVFDPAGAWSGYLVGFLLLSGVAVAGPFFLSLHVLSGATWSAPLLAAPRAMRRLLPASFLIGLGLLAGIHQLYEWSHASALAEDPMLARKSGWLNAGGFGLRLVVVFAAWFLLGRAVAPSSEGRRTGSLLKRSALFVAVFGVTYSVAAFDWVGSLNPHWGSTIFALDLASGLVSAGLAAVVILSIWLKRSGRLTGALTPDRLNDLGKLCLSFSLFWAYIAFCQYMLIWYVNLPEETSRYVVRSVGGFETLTWVNLALNWAVPFFVLLPKAARTSESVMLRVACVMLIGRAVDLWMHVAPTTTPSEALPGWAAIGAVAAAAAFGARALIGAASREAASNAEVGALLGLGRAA